MSGGHARESLESRRANAVVVGEEDLQDEPSLPMSSEIRARPGG